MNEEQERKFLINIIKKYLETNIENCKFMKQIYANNENNVKIINKSISQSKKSLEMIHQIKHLEVLRAIYGDCVGKIQAQLMVCGTLITSKTTQRFDKTEDGFEEFKRIQQENAEMFKQKMKEQKENAELISKAKEEGKKIEYMYDPKTKKTRPMVVEENNNA